MGIAGPLRVKQDAPDRQQRELGDKLPDLIPRGMRRGRPINVRENDDVDGGPADHSPNSLRIKEPERVP